MRAIGLTEHGGPEVLRELDLPRPAPGDGQVLVRVMGASVNFADIQTRKGAYHAAGASFPVVPGLDAMGVIEEVGAGVRALRIGQRVIAFPHSGSYCQYVLADQALAFAVPDAICFEQAAACPLVGFTAYMLLNLVARLEKGETVMIYAASGGVGASLIQIARALGAGQVIGVVGDAAKRGAVLDCGADMAACHKNDDWVEEIKAVTRARGVDVALDSLGGDYTAKALELLAPYGRLVAFGNASGGYYDVSTQLLHASCRQVLGFSIGSTRRMRPGLFEEAARAVFGLMLEGKLTIPVSRVLDLAQAGEAHRLIERGENTGKIVLRVS